MATEIDVRLNRELRLRHAWEDLKARRPVHPDESGRVQTYAEYDGAVSDWLEDLELLVREVFDEPA